MNERRPNDARPPRPEQLAAYLDGELDGAVRGEIEAWLAEHPDSAGDVEGQRRLLRLWQAALPPEPTEAEWGPVLARLQASIPSLPRARFLRWGGRRRSWRAVAWVAGALSAAAVAGVVARTTLLHQPPVQSVVPASSAPSDPIQPLMLVSADDIDIVSMDGDDDDALLVGEPPVTGPIVLASNGDIALAKAEPGKEGIPGVKMKEGVTGPMVVVPLETSVPGRDD
jgi:hypothetical protein